MEITFFYITVGEEAEAIALGNLAVERRLAACANIFPMQSIFPWHDKIQHAREFVLVLKTISSVKELLRELIEVNHTYDTPCILSWEAEVNEKYGCWMKEIMRQD